MNVLTVTMFSGATIAALSEEEFNQITETLGNSVKSLKQHLSGIICQPRFRQKLLCERGAVLQDDAMIELPASLVLVVLTFCPADDGERHQLLDAVTGDQNLALEQFLQRPLDPEPRHEKRETLRSIPWSILCVVSVSGTYCFTDLLGRI